MCGLRKKAHGVSPKAPSSPAGFFYRLPQSSSVSRFTAGASGFTFVFLRFFEV
jgi:hypothetical protein